MLRIARRHRALVAVTALVMGVGWSMPNASAASADEPVDRIGSFRPFGTVTLSDNGRVVVFTSNQTNLGVGGDADYDVFAFDRETRALELVSAMPNGSDPALPSLNAMVSGNGRFVVFQSAAQLTVGAPAGTQVYRRDLVTNTTALVSTGTPDILTGRSAGISTTGRYVAFVAESPDVFDAFYVRDISGGTTTILPEVRTDVGSWLLNVSTDGRFVSLTANGTASYLVDRGAGVADPVVQLPRPSWAGGSGPTFMSDNGRYVAYTLREEINPSPGDRQEVWLYDRTTGVARKTSASSVASFSGDGRLLGSSGRLFDLQTGASHTVPAGCAGGARLKTVEHDRVVYTTGTFNSTRMFVAPVPGLAARPYRLVAADGGVFTYGGARFFGSAATLPLESPVVAMAALLDNSGYWLVAGDGGVFTYGGAQFFGSLGALTLESPIVGMAAAPDGRGYWLVAGDGGVFAFGSARFFGSLGALTLDSPIVGMAAAPDGRGYWLVGADGGVFAFGSARFFGSAVGGSAAAVGIGAAPDGRGYWVASADGGVASFGSARFLGSLPGLGVTPNSPVVGLTSATDTCGYRLVAADGGVFPFGGSGFSGSAGALPLVSPVVSIG